ncbi:hypothetical protein [Litoribacillus peritrichatus]|uniref:Transcriptional regulator SutA RNAP-binding domain-containing protein n=1 Tax=Litoribacillus peritrichatus TaxID=718191 RepID=A0ABP7M8H2_9GAMM
MAVKSKSVSKKKETQAVETSLSIEEQTRAFLSAGGNIEQVNTGVSGQQSMKGTKHIVLNPSNLSTAPTRKN